MDLPGGKATVKEIYDHVEATHEFYRHCGAPWWKNCIRHNLSMQKCFVRHPNAGGMGVHLWSVAPGINSVDAIPCKRRGPRNTVVAKSKVLRPKRPDGYEVPVEHGRAGAGQVQVPMLSSQTAASEFALGGFEKLLQAAGRAEVTQPPGLGTEEQHAHSAGNDGSGGDGLGESEAGVGTEWAEPAETPLEDRAGEADVVVKMEAEEEHPRVDIQV